MKRLSHLEGLERRPDVGIQLLHHPGRRAGSERHDVNRLTGCPGITRIRNRPTSFNMLTK